ncbi:hypothetical protein BCR37DRAFT_385143 [Protomyces lactucae-debilis]|uniref:Uncharacterized protein n=1 Tax=Protomyces lactucae-debilis TaxID=2754530 RepID=A0A1Y2FV40_PROLT|nr:uncharacterized protein BCR37DRAFT_385143 [Protomyces lactucae-debilis]ORY87883.1 hypothetical protein BCR37DRAFT_385143 [Protomyces lactucae-debilis]
MSGFGLFEKVRVKLQADLTPDEFATLEKCGRQVRNDARIGSMIGAVVAILGMRRRKLWPLTKFPGRALFFIGGSTVVGMQIGVVVGSISAASTVQTMPKESQHRVMKAIREVQVEQQDKIRRGGPLGEIRVWEQKSTTDMPMDAANEGMPADPSRPVDASLRTPFNGPGPMASSQEPQHQSNVWQQLRGENGGRPQTAWEKLRSGRDPNARAAGQQANQTATADPFTPPPDDSVSPAKLPAQSTSRGSDSESRLPEDKARSQSEFDKLLDQERAGFGVDFVENGSHPMASNKQPRRNKFGDVEV